jgi:hypothetical protein
VHSVTGNGDFDHIRVEGLPSPNIELPQFWRIPEMDRVMRITGDGDCNHNRRALVHFISVWTDSAIQFRGWHYFGHA